MMERNKIRILVMICFLLIGKQFLTGQISVKIISIQQQDEYNFVISATNENKDSFHIYSFYIPDINMEKYQKIEIDSIYSLELECNKKIYFELPFINIENTKRYNCTTDNLLGVYIISSSEKREILNEYQKTKKKWWQRLFKFLSLS
ncbi:MAG: hypothetical protein LBV75_04850 [Paludibacter sp.]|jgi:hypothetical protein|nr:hypothetical protein [Paludibacter sp.]